MRQEKGNRDIYFELARVYNYLKKSIVPHKLSPHSDDAVWAVIKALRALVGGGVEAELAALSKVILDKSNAKRLFNFAEPTAAHQSHSVRPKLPFLKYFLAEGVTRPQAVAGVVTVLCCGDDEELLELHHGKGGGGI
jgi:hypothetical protein